MSNDLIERLKDWQAMRAKGYAYLQLDEILIGLAVPALEQAAADYSLLSDDYKALAQHNRNLLAEVVGLKAELDARKP